MSCKRTIFIIFNLLFFLLGLASLGVGIYSIVVYTNWMSIIKDSKNLIQAANLLIGAGVVIALLGFLGCFGAWKKCAKSLLAYALLVLIIFALQIAAGVYAYTKQGEFKKELETGVNDAVNLSYGKTDAAAKGLTKAVDWFQENVKCCGSTGPADWKNSVWFKNLANNSTIVPSSCCVTKKNGCNVGTVAALGTNIYTKGCIAQGIDFAKSKIKIIGAVGVGIGVIELLGILTAFLVYKEFKEHQTI